MASKEYFEDAIKKHNFTGKGDGGNSDFLLKDYTEKTKGLDKDVAFEALEGGRHFGESDKKRYDELMAKRGQAKETAQEVKSDPKVQTQESFNNAQNFVNEKTQQSFNTGENSANVNTQQTISQNRNFGDNENTIGNDNKFFGNVNQGNQDFSINIANQQSGGRSTAGGGTMSNAAEGAAAKAGFENTYQRSQAQFNPMGFAAKNVDAANELGGTNDLIKGLDRTTDANIDYYRKSSDRSTLGLYGDIWNMKAPSWKAPGDLDKIETTYDKDD